MAERSEEFLKSLYEEKLRHKDHRNTFVLNKLFFTIGLFGLGTIKITPINLDFLLYFVPFVALAYDVYIVAEDYKVKRIGVFLRSQCSTICEDEKKWEKWLKDHREPLAAYASLMLTLITLIACAILVFLKNQTLDSCLFLLWLLSSFGLMVLTYRYSRILGRRLDE